MLKNASAIVTQAGWNDVFVCPNGVSAEVRNIYVAQFANLGLAHNVAIGIRDASAAPGSNRKTLWQGEPKDQPYLGGIVLEPGDSVCVSSDQLNSIEAFVGVNLDSTTATGFYSYTQAALMALVDESHQIALVAFSGAVSAVNYVPDGDVTGTVAPAQRKWDVINTGQDGLGTTNVASLTLTAGNNLVTDVAEAITLSAVPGALDVLANDVLVWKSTHVGATGKADPGGIVQVKRIGLEEVSVNKKEILREIDRLRAEVDQPEPDLRDVMDKLDDIEDRLGQLERRAIQVIPQPYPVPQPILPVPWPRRWPGPYSTMRLQGDLQHQINDSQVFDVASP